MISISFSQELLFLIINENLQVFGTAVNWRYSVVAKLASSASTALSDSATSLPSTVRINASTIDWAAFAQAWRMSYKKFTRSYPHSPIAAKDGETPFKMVDQHHYESLVELLEANGMSGLWSEKELLEISRVWHFLAPWPDSSRGLDGLKSLGIQTCTLSNGNVSLLKDMADFAHLHWIQIFSSEHFGAYKPSPVVYKGAVEELGLEVEEVAMVAAHLGDLKAAKACGLKTVYVERPMEEDFNAEQIEAAKREGWVDVWVSLEDGEEDKRGFLELVRRLAIL